VPHAYTSWYTDSYRLDDGDDLCRLEDQRH